MSAATEQRRPTKPADDSVSVPPGYTRTELGVLPQDWETCRLGEIGQCLIGLTYDPSNVKSDGLLVLRSSNIGDSGLRFDDNVFVDIEVPDRIIVRDGDLLICVRNGSRPLIGKCALIDQRTAGMTFGAFMAVFRSPYNAFVAYCFHADLVRRQIHEHLGATINQITNKSLNSFTVPFPPLPEQRAIAEALSDVDGLLGALEALIAKRRAIKQAAMHQLLTGKTRLSGFRGPWETKRLGEIADVDPENLSSSTNPDLRFNYISLEQVDAGRLFGHSEETFRTAPSRARRILRHDDVLMATVRPNLMAHLFFRDQVPNAVCSTGFAVIRARRGVSAPGFLFAHLFGDVVNKQIERTLEGSNYPAINHRDVKLIEVPCPPTAVEQTAIATVLSDMDAEIAALERRRDKTRAIKQGMMQELLTGRVRLVAA